MSIGERMDINKEKRGSREGVLVLCASFWILLVWGLNLTYELLLMTFSPSPLPPLPLFVEYLSIPVLCCIAGCLGIIAGVRIYTSGALKGKTLSFTTWVLGLGLVVANFLYSLQFLSISTFFHDFLLIAPNAFASSCPLLLLTAGIPKHPLPLGWLITIFSIPFLLSYLIDLLADTINALLYPPVSLIHILSLILLLCLCLTGALGIIAGLWIHRGVTRGAPLAIYTGVLGIFLIALLNLLWVYNVTTAPPPLLQGVDLVFYYMQHLPDFIPVSLFLVGGLLARSTNVRLTEEPPRSPSPAQANGEGGIEELEDRGGQ